MEYRKRKYLRFTNILYTLVFILSVSLFSIQTVFAEAVHICDDAAEWPPYIYYQRVNGKPDKSTITGATVDLLKALFKEIKMEFTIELLPWKRCLTEVDQFGQSGKYEVFVDGSYNEERYNKYYLSTPLYKTHVGVFYSKKRFPEGPPITQASDLNQYRLCGMFGYNFEPFISAGVTTNISTAGKNNTTNFLLLEKQRYDFFLSAIEPVYGSHVIGQHTIPEEIMSFPVLGIKKFTFYLFVAKSSPRAFELYTKINQAIIKLHETGISEAIFKKYLPGGTGL